MSDSSYVTPFVAAGSITGNTELSPGRMDPRVESGRVESGHDFAGFWRVGSSRVSTSDFLFFFTDYFLVPESI